MKKITIILSGLFLSVLVMCTPNKSNNEGDDTSKSTEDSGTVALDLSDKGIPVMLQVPTGCEVKDGMGMGDLEGVKILNYEVTKGKFILSVSMTDAPMYQGAADYYAFAMNLAKESEGFVSVIKEEPNGFIFKKNTDEGDDYDFYYLFTKDKKAIEFETGLNLLSGLTLKEAERLYEAAKSAK